MPQHPTQKNIVHGSITAGGDVHIGDIIYNIERDFKSGSILFLRLDKKDDTHYEANLSVKSKHSEQGNLSTSGEKWCENIELNIPTQLFEALNEFQTFRRGVDNQMRLTGLRSLNPSSVIDQENQLSRLIFQTFFAGEIGKVCVDFIKLLEEQRIEELLLAISADDETIVNLPFEMALPLLFPPKLGEAKKSLAISNFGLVRTKIASLDSFNLQGEHASTAPLKMLFITALPENLDERGKMLQIEEEQTRLIRAIGALEATGDKEPKIVIEFLENASLAELDKALHARQHDIVHISGHGAYHAATNKGVLYFENEDGDEEQISGAALGETVRKHQCVKLLILSACETAIAGSEGGVIEQVAAYGIPSIVAMRFAVTDDGAKVFTTELYTQLAKGLSLTRALAYAREALLQDIAQRREQTPHILHIAEWFTPVVYQNQALGALIDVKEEYNEALLKNFYPSSSFLKTRQSRLIGEGFIGRKRYLIQLRQAFRAGRHVCLYGLGGLGKTTLAEAFAHNYDNHSYSTLIFRKDHQINEAHILKILQEEFAEINPRLAKQAQQAIDDPQTEVLDKLQLLIDNYLQGRKTILIFDNAEDVQTDEGGAYQRSIGSESLSAFLRHLCLNTPANCHILFTTRYKIDNLDDVLEHLPLDKMGYAEQYRLLNYSETLRTIPLEQRDDVYKRLDGHPRGYEYLEALLKKDKTFSWQQVSQAEAEVFENLLLANVYERLTEREKAIFQIGAVFITRTPLAALAAVSAEEEEDLLPVLQALQDWSLCFLEKDGRFEVHRLTRDWMIKNIISYDKIKEWAFKTGEYFWSLKDEGFNIKISDAISAKEYFEIAEDWEFFIMITNALSKKYILNGFYNNVIEINNLVLRKNVSEYDILNSLNYIGNALSNKGDYENAIQTFKQALKIAQDSNSKGAESALVGNLASIYMNLGNYNNALFYFEEGLKLDLINNDKIGIMAKYNNMSRLYKFKGEFSKSLEYSSYSLEIVRTLGDENSEAIILDNMGLTYIEFGDLDTALNFSEKSLKIFQRIGNRNSTATTLNNIANIYMRKKDFDLALKYLESSIQISEEIGDINSLAISLDNASIIHKHKSNYDKALAYSMKSLSIFQSIGNRRSEAITLHNIGSIFHEKGNIKDAFLYLFASLDISDKIGNIDTKAKALLTIGEILFEQEQFEDAVPLLVQAYSIFQKIGSQNVQVIESYLVAIIERIGEAKFQEILSQLNQE